MQRFHSKARTRESAKGPNARTRTEHMFSALAYLLDCHGRVDEATTGARSSGANSTI